MSTGSPVPSDWELWAVANHVLGEHGDKAPLFVAKRIGALALRGDRAGVAAWREIARRLVQLEPVAKPSLHS